VRKIGLIGGLSWYSTRTYYETINLGIQKRTNSPSGAPMVIESLDFADLVRLSDDAEWQRAGEALAQAAQRLEAAGATATLGLCAAYINAE